MARELEQSLTDSTTSSQTVRIARVQTTRFDDYVIVGKLGHGGMAEVFLALETGVAGFRKLIVIKRLHRHLCDEPEMVGMFMDEARLAARLNHPHVVQTNKIGNFEGQRFLAMEYLEGQPFSRVLKRLKRRDERFPIPLTARVIADALDGLDYAHELKDFDGTPLNIVHRDISPQNIFVTYDGAVKVLDFGIAKSEAQEAMTRTGLVKGKFAYISPEQAEGELVDRRADIWSMGVVLWESLTAERLFKAGSELATLSETLKKEIVAPHEVDPTIPEELSLAAMKALQRDLGQRVETAGGMKEGIDDYLSRHSKEANRRELGTFMRELFADTIEEQRVLIKQCIDRVDSGEVGVSSSEQAAADLEETVLAMPPDGTPSASHVSPKATDSQESERRPVGAFFLRVAVIVLIGMMAGVIALLWPRGDDDDDAIARTDGNPVVAPVPDPVEPPPEEESTNTAGTRAPDGEEGADPDEDGEGDESSTADGEDETETETETETEASDPDPTPPRRRWRPRRRGTRRSAPQEQSSQQEEETPPPQPQAQETGHLTLDTEPWSVVMLGNRRLGMTPLVNVELPAGTHMLRLRNPELDISTSYRVTIPANGRVTRRLVIE